MFRWLEKWRRKEASRGDKRRGQGLVEYALILVLVAVVVLLILPAVGEGVSNIFRTVVCTLDSGSCPAGGGSSAGCTNESLGLTNVQCSGNDLVFTPTSSCSGATLSTSPNSPAVGECSGGMSSVNITINIKSEHPDGTVNTESFHWPP